MSKNHLISYTKLMDSKHAKYSYMKDAEKQKNTKAAEIGTQKPYAACYK